DGHKRGRPGRRPGRHGGRAGHDRRRLPPEWPHTILVSWGDGSPDSTLTLDAGAKSFSFAHNYAQDAAQPYAVTVTVKNAEGLSSSATASVQVLNVAPSSLAIGLSASKINENGSTTLSGTFADAGALDTHTVTIDWGDQSTTTVNLAAGVLTFSTSH